MQLQIQNFSSIREATVDIALVTLIIGPQGSGKSVISKLLYFMNDTIRKAPISVESGHTYEFFIKEIEQEFVQWFPYSAWGEKRLLIRFVTSKHTFEFTRARSHAKSARKIRFNASISFQEYYISLFKLFEKMSEVKVSRKRFDEFELPWRFMSLANDRARKSMGTDYFDSQIFIPAGRSFFTVFGKAMTAFEQGNLLDPTTVRFGKIFAQTREMLGRHVYYYPRHEQPKWAKEFSEILLGGELKFERDKEFVISQDGRRIPLSVLSSGQQELLPLLLTLEHGILSRGGDGRRLVFIEEPEAHLFPASQSLLIELLATLLSFQKQRLSLVLTTHSPYVLSKFNNLIFAAALSKKSEARRARIETIVPKLQQISGEQMNVYAIVDGKLLKINEPDQICGDYLDDISSQLGSQYEALLEIEGEMNVSK